MRDGQLDKDPPFSPLLLGGAGRVGRHSQTTTIGVHRQRFAPSRRVGVERPETVTNRSADDDAQTR